jgi:iron complex outermembrane recepter protein
MTRSRRRKLERERAKLAARKAFVSIPIATLLAGAPIAMAQEVAQETGALEEVVVTAQKRAEDLQDVPLSITALSTARLEELGVKDFDDFAKFLPSLSYTTAGPGFARVYFRGVAAGDNGNHSGSQPSVGIYLDEQPITTIQGALDLHAYDIARVEALAGPQGTLYGASSQAGTIRYITNKPKLDAFEAGYDLEGSVLSSEAGYVAEGFLNLPVGSKAAVRLVGWGKREPGYIDNIATDRTYPTAGVTINNASFADDSYNDVETYGARAALRLELNDRWTITPTLMAQNQEANGAFAFDPSIGTNRVARYRPESSKDEFAQLGLTIEGKIANLDLTYAGGYLLRDDETESDYSDYSYFYDVLYGSVFTNPMGDPIDPSQYIQGKDRYRRWSHEVRIATPLDNRWRFIGGLFAQRQQHGIQQRYIIDGLDNGLEVGGWPDTIWLTQQTRVDRDQALFGEFSYDFNDQFTATVGGRFFKAENSLDGYFGFGWGYSTSGRSGEGLCSLFVGAPIRDANGDPLEELDESRWTAFRSVSDAPCKNLERTVDEDGFSPKVNLQYKIDEDRMVYFTYSEGFRPGGVNRRGTFPPYEADYLNNIEIGWKTTTEDGRLRVNGAVFSQRWDDFQYSFLGENGLTNIVNAGNARIKGIEADINWAATDNLLIYGSATLLDATLSEYFCKFVDADGAQLAPADCLNGNGTAGFANRGERLPVTAKFKGNLTGRYSFKLGSFDAFAQGSISYEGNRRSALISSDEEAQGGANDAYSIANISAGIQRDSIAFEVFVSNLFDESAEIARFTQCDPAICSRPYVITNLPRQIGIKFSQKF